MDTSFKKIGLVSPARSAIALGLSKMLARSFSATFEIISDCAAGSFDGLIVLDGPVPKQEPAVPTLLVLPASRLVANASVQFANASPVPAVFRNRVVPQTPAAVFGKEKLSECDEILASSDGEPVWAARKEGSNRSQMCAVDTEQFEKAQPLVRRLSGDAFLQMLPIIHFIRQITGEDTWSSPPLRANLMLDDPNLHATHYGWVNFREIARHASLHNYHASMATIPLDAWFESKAAVNLFAENQARLSLVVHGNDHLHRELASFSSEEQSLASLAQALRRVSRLEAKTSLAISRVMVAPHGACSEETLRVLASLGFEAACIRQDLLHRYNSDKEWADAFGLGLSELVAGLPVIPRFALTHDCQNDCLLAAYLDQPIIPVGHHEDVADGLQLFEEIAGFINSLGKVHWLHMKDIARLNYQTRNEGNLLQVRSYARIFNLTVPSGVTQISIHRPNSDGATTEGIRIGTPGNTSQFFPSYAGEPIPVQPGASLGISFVLPNQIDPNSVRAPKLRIWPLARRVMTESRDRLAPFASPITGKARQNGNVKSRS
jgi:hypothetical protein